MERSIVRLGTNKEAPYSGHLQRAKFLCLPGIVNPILIMFSGFGEFEHDT